MNSDTPESISELLACLLIVLRTPLTSAGLTGTNLELFQAGRSQAPKHC